MFFENKAYFNRNIGKIEYYKVFLDFNKIVLEESNKYINEIVREDSYHVFNSNNKYVDLEYI